MRKWREIERYPHGTPTKTTKKLRRRHFFTVGGGQGGREMVTSPCGIRIFSSQMSEEDTESEKCKHCLKVIRKQKK